MLFMPQLIEFLKESYTVGTINVMSILQMKKQQHRDYLDKGQLATWQRRENLWRQQTRPCLP